jgi:hypothetical protein
MVLASHLAAAAASDVPRQVESTPIMRVDLRNDETHCQTVKHVSEHLSRMSPV